VAVSKDGPQYRFVIPGTRYLPGHPDYIKVFANPVAADEWCNENDPEGVAFEYEVLE